MEYTNRAHWKKEHNEQYNKWKDQIFNVKNKYLAGKGKFEENDKFVSAFSGMENLMSAYETSLGSEIE